MVKTHAKCTCPARVRPPREHGGNVEVHVPCQSLILIRPICMVKMHAKCTYPARVHKLLLFASLARSKPSSRVPSRPPPLPQSSCHSNHTTRRMKRKRRVQTRAAAHLSRPCAPHGTQGSTKRVPIKRTQTQACVLFRQRPFGVLPLARSLARSLAHALPHFAYCAF